MRRTRNKKTEWRVTMTRQGGDYQPRLVCDATHDTGLQGWKLIGVGLLVVHYVAKKQKWCVTMAPMGFALAPEENIPAVHALVGSLLDKCQDAFAPGTPREAHCQPPFKERRWREAEGAGIRWRREEEGDGQNKRAKK